MWQAAFIALRVTAVTLLLTGIAYPVLVTSLAQTLFSAQANGSLVTDAGGGPIGSELIGQPFTQPGYLWPRPSAAGDGYDGLASGGTNLGPTSTALHERITDAVRRLRESNPDARGPVPIDLVTASASGLDPHLSPAAALWQVPRVARARGVAEGRVRTAIERQIEGRDLGVLGEPRVNVLRVNLALDALFGRPPSAPLD